MSANMEIDAVEYDNGQKNNWRRALWNKIERHVPNKYEALILYLPGEEGLDRIEATHRKYKPHCLIAVEREKAIVKKLRAEGQICVHGTLQDAMSSWPGSHPVDFVVADLQCPMSPTVVEVCNAWFSTKAFSKAGLLLNLQRGREHWSARLATNDRMRFVEFLKLLHAFKDVDVKNRFWQAYAELIRDGAIDLESADSTREGHSVLVQITDDMRSKMVDGIAAMMLAIRPEEFRSYVSNVVTMDSGFLWNRFQGVKKVQAHKLDRPDSEPMMVRKIAAALAIRTMRMNR